MQESAGTTGKAAVSREEFRATVVRACMHLLSVQRPQQQNAPIQTGVRVQVNTLQRKAFFMPSFEIYGSVAGFYDYGPNGCKVKQNITQFWRQHFVLHENMLEVRCC